MSFYKAFTFSALSSPQPWEVYFLFVDVIVKSPEFKELGQQFKLRSGKQESALFFWVPPWCLSREGEVWRELELPSCRRRLQTDEGWTEAGAWLGLLRQHHLLSTKCTQGKKVSVTPLQSLWDTTKITMCCHPASMSLCYRISSTSTWTFMTGKFTLAWFGTARNWKKSKCLHRGSVT